MKKLVVLSGGLVAVGSAALIGAGVAMSQPVATLNVVGEPYQKALQILKARGTRDTSADHSAVCCRRRTAWSTARR